jgi:hypothetical protein
VAADGRDQLQKCENELRNANGPIFDETHVEFDLQLSALLDHLDRATVWHQRLHRAQHIAAAPTTILNNEICYEAKINERTQKCKKHALNRSPGHE